MNSAKLKGKILEAGYTQRTLADPMGMSKNTLNGKINGRIPFNTLEINRLCEILGISDDSEKVHIFLS